MHIHHNNPQLNILKKKVFIEVLKQTKVICSQEYKILPVILCGFQEKILPEIRISFWTRYLPSYIPKSYNNMALVYTDNSFFFPYHLPMISFK